MRKARWIYLFVLITDAVLYIATSHSALLIFGIFLAAMAIISGFMLIIGKRHITIRTEVQDVSTVSENLPVRIKIRMNGRALTGNVSLYMNYHNIMFDEYLYQELILNPGEQAENGYALPVNSQLCGKVCIAMEKAWCYDILGIFRCRIQPSEDMAVIIYPRIKNIEITRTNIPDSGFEGETYDKVKKGQDVTEVFALRDYHEGDSVRSIHWKLSGKLDRMIVREFGNPSDYQMVVAIDSCLPMGITEADGHRLVNNVMGTMMSVSRSLMHYNINHHVVMVSGRSASDTPVEDKTSYMKMVRQVLCSTYTYEQAFEVDYFLKLEIYRRFSKLLIITASSDTQYIKKLSEYINVTAIILTTDGQQQIEKGLNDEIISIPVDDFKDKVHAIEI